ncbi:MAG: type IV pilus modification protein PilV [Gammaproteobacteria bacterium]|jgi:type IV pilus assembly protein PilV
MRQKQKGTTLLEVLIAVLILSIGLLGHSKIQALGVRAATDANLRTQATTLANEMIERLRANRPAADSGYYSTIDYAGIDCNAGPAKICSEGTAGSAVDCTMDEIANEDAVHWFCAVEDSIPNGNVAVSVAAGVYSIQVSWDGLDENGATQSRNVSSMFIP